MQFWIIQTLNSVALGGLLFMLSSGFSLIFGLMRVPNLAHGAFFMLGAYVGAAIAAPAAALLRLRVPDLPAGSARHRARRGRRALCRDGAHAARRHDPG